jgi:hypothetical protein
VLGKRKQAFTFVQFFKDCLRRSLKGGLKRDNPEGFAFLGFLFALSLESKLSRSCNSSRIACGDP